MTDELRVPSAVRVYFTAIDDGDAVRAARCFTDDAVVATPPLNDETGDRVVRRGRSQLLHALAQRGVPTWRHRLTRAVADDDAVLVEGELLPLDSDEQLATFVVVVTLDPTTELISAFRSYRRQRSASHAAATADAIGPWLELLGNAVASSRRAPTDLVMSDLASVSFPEHDPIGGVPRSSAVERVFSAASSLAITGRGSTIEFAVLADFGDDDLVDALTVHWCTL